MIGVASLQIALVALMFSLGGFLFLRGRVRSSRDVLIDLEDSSPAAENERVMESWGRERNKEGPVVSPLVSLLAGALFLAVELLVVRAPLPAPILFFVLGAALSYLFQRWRLSKRGGVDVREIEYFLPIVMERIVMAVEAGLDIGPALNAVVDLEVGSEADAGERAKQLRLTDPVTRLLARVVELCNAGVPFEKALREVSTPFDCAALRHAFIHLGVAQREGGEVVLPLRELSDSTQLYFQETVEEEIAKMPVKATAPLVLTFAGLILCFMTTPLIQITSITAKATHSTEGRP